MKKTMENICRLCLSIVNHEIMTNFLSSSDIIDKIRDCISVEIIVNESLPQHICKMCLTVLDNLFEFRQRTTNNQIMLLQELSKGKEALELFYTKLKNYENKQESFINIDNKENINVTPFNDNIVVTHEENCNDSIIMKNEKSEVGFNDTVENSSDDDNIKLSTLKLKKDTQKTTKHSKKRFKEKDKLVNSETTKKPNQDELVYPEATPDNEELWKCLTCFSIYDSRSILLNHYKTEHYKKTDSFKENDYKVNITLDGTKMYKCMKCDKEYEKIRCIKRHLVSHMDDRPFVCNICGRTYKTADEIFRHGRVHNGFKPLLCKEQGCGYTTVYLGALKTHMKTHKTDYKFVCSECGRGFHVRTWFEQHQNVHAGVKPFVCHLCGTAFHMERYLSTHKSVVHPQWSTVRRYVCLHCPYSCSSKVALNKHVKVHGITGSYLCDICGKSLSTREHLKFHRQTHSGEKPHTCSTCGKGFIKKCNLKSHQRTHAAPGAHGSHRLACAECSRTYSHRDKLVLHVKKHHSGTRPFQCVKCPNSFVLKSQLLKHQRSCT